MTDIRLMDATSSERAINMIQAAVSGENVYKYLKFESEFICRSLC